MKELIFIWVEFVTASALLLAFYWVILRHRASYKFNRLYLISIPLLSIMMSGMTFEIPMETPQIIERNLYQFEKTLPMAQVAQTEIQFQQPIVINNATEETMPATATPVVEVAKSEEKAVSINFLALVKALIPAISILLLLVGIYYIGRLLYIKSRLNAEKTIEGYDLIRSEEVSTPFSFAKTIFLPTQLDSDREEMIIHHEKAHIAHGHYIEVWFIELMTRLLWFNPIIWLCRSELGNVHEYEADHDVISRGANVLAYQTTLLEMVLNESCPVVNGFNHSFIRQRFIEMKSTTAGTLGKWGKLSMIVWVAVLFCTFTIQGCKPAGGNITTQDLWNGVPELPEPQLFVIEGTVDPNITDSCYNIYLGDESFHIDDDAEPVMCIPVEDKKFRLELPLTKVTVGRLRCIFPGNELCSAWIDLFFVPGETVEVTVMNGTYLMTPKDERNYQTKVERSVHAVRNLCQRTTEGAPVPNGKVWKKVSGTKHEQRVFVNQVFFNKEATIVHLMAREMIYSIPFSSKSFLLTDQDGKIYQQTGRTMESEGNWSKETRTFGAYYYFEPVDSIPTTLELLSGLIQGHENETLECIANDIQEDTSFDGEPNFTLHIAASSGIADNAYLIRIQDKDEPYYELVADLHLNENRECTFRYHLDEERLGLSICTFPDGSVCTHCERFPFVPGDTAYLRVYNGSYHLTGSGFYKEWGEADEAVENASKFNNPEETHQKIEQYLKDHSNEYGCLSYYYYQIGCPAITLFEVMSDEMKESKLGKELQTIYERDKKTAELAAKYANDPLYMEEQDINGPFDHLISDELWDSWYKDHLDQLEVVKKYKGNDPKRPYAEFPRSLNGVIIYRLKSN